MQRCQTPGMCMPHGGCKVSVLAQTNVRYSNTSADTKRVAAPVRVHQANVFLPGCLGPVRRDVVLEDDYRDRVTALEAEVERLQSERERLCAIVELTPELEEDGETLVSLVTQAKNAVTGATVAWEEQCARVDELEAEAAMRRNIEYAAQHLPAGWLIRVSVEFEGSSVELINPDGEDVDFPSNHESLAQEVRDAVDALINPEPEEAGELPPPPAGLVAPVPGPDERICWQEDCGFCGGTGREPDGSRCLGEIPF